jgi:hypothetical protein
MRLFIIIHIRLCKLKLEQCYVSYIVEYMLFNLFIIEVNNLHFDLYLYTYFEVTH